MLSPRCLIAVALAVLLPLALAGAADASTRHRHHRGHAAHATSATSRAAHRHHRHTRITAHSQRHDSVAQRRATTIGS